jgi:hypothetical protein
VRSRMERSAVATAFDFHGRPRERINPLQAQL